MKGLVIASPVSGSGKTTVALGLMAVLRREGYRVQGFKCGPDFIDTQMHGRICDTPSYNLDTYMMSAKKVRQLYDENAAKAQFCIVEGMMGLYDGYQRMSGSTAEVALTLGLPVLLVVNAKSMGHSAGALIKGFAEYHAGINICGVVFNNAGSAGHKYLLTDAAHWVGVHVYGCIPTQRNVRIGERYLGLDITQDVDRAALCELMDEHVAWKQLMEL